MPFTTSDLLLLLSIGVVQLLAVISPGPSFLITARTAVARSRVDGFRVALGLTAGTIIWSSAALLGLNAVFQAMPLMFMAQGLWRADRGLASAWWAVLSLRGVLPAASACAAATSRIDRKSVV